MFLGLLLALLLDTVCSGTTVSGTACSNTAASLTPSADCVCGSRRSELLIGLSHRWPLNEASGPRLDVIGTLHFTDQNGPGGVPGQVDNAIQFTRAASTYLFTSANFVFPDSYTLSFWENTNTADIPSLPTYISSGATFPNSVQLLVYSQFASVEQMIVLIGDGTASQTAVAGGTFSNGWNFWNVSYDASDKKARLYRNTVLVATTNALAGTAYRTPSQVRMGGTAMAVTSYMGGKMDEAILHDRILTDLQRAELYINGKEGIGLTPALQPPTPSIAETWLTYGDSKTAGTGGFYQPPLANFMYVSNPGIVVTYGPSFPGFSDGILAIGGQTADSMQALIDGHLASASGGGPNRIFVNLGANEIPTLPTEAAWKSDMGYIMDAFHTKWPAAHVYVARPWRQGYNTESDTVAGWVSDLVAARSPWAHLGTDERVFLKFGADDGATFTSDGIHPNTKGYSLTAEAWREVLGY